MAKRFTDSEKWKKPWFRKLSPTMKLVWGYILDNCDHAGIWPGDFELMAFQMGLEVTQEEFLTALGDKVQECDGGKFFIPAFIEFQYGALNPDNNAHRGVIKILQKVGAHEGLVSPMQGAQDKDKDKDSSLREGGVGETQTKPIPELPSTLAGNAKSYPKLAQLTPDSLAQVFADWLETLRHFGMARKNLLADEDRQLGIALAKHGLPAVRFALQGARNEPKSARFNPAEFLSLDRILKPENFQRFLNLGVAAHHRSGGAA